MELDEQPLDCVSLHNDVLNEVARFRWLEMLFVGLDSPAKATGTGFAKGVTAACTFSGIFGLRHESRSRDWRARQTLLNGLGGEEPIGCMMLLLCTPGSSLLRLVCLDRLRRSRASAHGP